MKYLIGLLALFPALSFAQITYNDGVCGADANGTDVEWACSEVSAPPPPPPPPSDDGLLYTDLVRAPRGTPITGFCSDGSTDRVGASETITLCGDSVGIEITNGELIVTGPPNIPQANDGDVIMLTAGTYSANVNCGGRDTSWCGDNNSGVQIIGDTSGPKPVLEGAYDCGAASGGVSGITLANVDARVTCDRRGDKRDTRFVNIYCADKASRSSGACGNWSATQKLRVFGFETERTGVAGENNAHSLYHGGRGISFDVEFAYNTMRDHVGGRCFQVYGHRSGEEMRDIYVHHNVAENCQGNAAFLISHTDGQSGTPDERSWIDSVQFDNNVCIGNRAQFRGRNLNGGQDWNADGNQCPVDSSMGGSSDSWVGVTNNTGPVSGNVR